MAQLTRRRVIEAGAAAVGGLVAAGAAGPQAYAARRRLPLREAFERGLGRTFTARRDGVKHRLRLVKVTDLAAGRKRQRQVCFNLLFEPAGRGVPPEGIYRLRRPGMRPVELFLSPVGGDDTIQALVNRAR